MSEAQTTALKYERFYVNESWAQWVAVSVLLSSFAIIINNINSLNGGEPKVASFMISLAILIMSVMTPINFVERWGTAVTNGSLLSKVTMGFMIVIACLLVIAFIWLLLRIWIEF
jgi:hypothetical protein